MSNGVSPDVLEKGTALEATGPHAAVSRSAGYAVAAKPSRIANPGSLGLFSFASTTLMLSLYNTQTRGISHPNVVLGMALFCGGLAQLLAGMWEFPRGNTFGGTAFTSYGAFWLSYAAILIPGTGVGAAFTDKDEFASAVAIFLLTWFLVTFFLLIVSLRKSVAFIVLFGSLSVTFLLLSFSEFYGSTNTAKAGGGLGVFTAFVAYYIGLSEMLAAEDMAIIRLPLGTFTKRV